MSEVFIQLGLTLGLALVMSLVMKLLRQPLIIGYILTGLIVGPAMTGLVPAEGALEAFSHIGVALLLFIVGLGLKPKLIKEVGKVAIITGLVQIIFTTIGGYIIAFYWLKFDPIVAFYISLAFALSSTIIILRLLYNKEEQDTLYGRITIGFLLVQDIVAMIFFIILSASTTIATGGFSSVILFLLGKLVLVALGIYILIKFVIPHIDRLFADNKELLFLFAIGICFVLASVFYYLDFSLELGALMAGVVLSVSPYQREIALRIQSLRDFFLIIFFIVLGTNVHLNDISQSIPMIFIFSAFIVIGNPIIMVIVMRWLKYTIKTSFLAGLTVSQISEFSIIIISMGVGLGHLPKSILGPATIVGIITITVSSYYISYNHQIYKFFFKPLHFIFSDKGRKEEKSPLDEKYEVIVFGSHRLGGGLIYQMQKMKIKFLVIDHDPEIVRKLKDQSIPCIYGSADDTELLAELPIRGAKLAISTIPELDVNLTLISFIKLKHRRTKFLCIANHQVHAEKLYKTGATYVIMPPYLGRRFMADLFKKNKLNLDKYKQEKEKHIFDLKYFEELQFLND